MTKHMARVMSEEESSQVATAWELSAECAKLQERQKALKEAIAQKTGIYSGRC